MTTKTLTRKQPSNIVTHLDSSIVSNNSFQTIYENAYSTSLAMAFDIIDRKNDKQTQRERAQIDDTEMLSVLLGEREREG